MTATSSRGAAPMDERMRARRRRVRHEQARRRRRYVLSVLALVSITALGAVVVRSPLFELTDIRVTGASGDRAEAVRQASGLQHGENLLFADLDGARERVNGLAWVRDVAVRRVPPTVIEIHVAPREPVAVLRAGGGAWLVDIEGVVLAGGTREGLPEVSAPQALTPVAGAPLGDDAVANALAVHAALPGPLRALVARYDAPSVPGLRLLLDAGGGEADIDRVWVRFGAAERVDAKARVIGLLLDEARARDATAVELDVRAPDNPVLVPHGPDHPDGGEA
jgi:cell division protein FtsQ